MMRHCAQPVRRSTWLPGATLLMLGGCLSALLSGPAAAATAGPIASLAPGTWYQVPNSQLQSVAPTTSVPGATGLASVIIAWSGGAYDTKRDRLLVWGGGHTDYAGNEIYAFDLNALTWSRLTDPSSPTGGSEASGMYGDGTPRSTHSYDALQYSPQTDRMVVLGLGSVYQSGQRSGYAGYFDFTSNKWVTAAAKPVFGYEDSAVTGVDPTTGYVWYGAGEDQHLLKYDPAQNTWTTYGNGSGKYTPSYSTGAVDPVHKIFLIAGNNQITYFDLNNPSTPMQTPPTSGDKTPESWGSPGLVYDTGINKFVAWAGGSTVYTLDPTTWVWTKITAASTNTVTPTAPPSQGTFGRFRYSPNLGVYVVTNGVDQDVYIYRLGAAPKKPDPPTNVTAH